MSSRKTIDMQCGQPRTFDSCRWTQLVVKSGVIWLTASNRRSAHTDDVFLHPGDSYALPPGLKVVSEAIGGHAQIMLKNRKPADGFTLMCIKRLIASEQALDRLYELHEFGGRKPNLTGT